jgi:hypothetical protein
MGKKITVGQKWHQQPEAATAEAEKLPHGKEREALERKARQLARVIRQMAPERLASVV